MKLKYITLLFTLIIVITFSFTENFMRNENYDKVDIIKINDTYKNVEEELNKVLQSQANTKSNYTDKSNDNMNESNNEIYIKDDSIDKIEEKYDCHIVMMGDKEYQSVVYNSIKEGRILMDYYNSDKIVGKIIFKGQSDIYNSMTRDLKKKTVMIFLSILVIGYIYIYIIYINIVSPFNKLKNFAGNITRGNLDFPLQINRHNYFGAFTEGFDLMRAELKKLEKGNIKLIRIKKN